MNPREMHFSITNANYTRVAVVMERYLREQDQDLCRCQRCLNDIAALSLNYLPPHYIADEEPEGASGSPWVMVETAVAEAIKTVKNKPHHAGGIKKQSGQRRWERLLGRIRRLF